MSTPASRQTQASARGEFAILAASGCLALLPYVLHLGLFRRLYWFGDEFDLIDQIDRMGFWRWTWLVFAENFVPLFKVLWGGGVFVFGGSYAAMIGAVWLIHGLNVALLGRLMRTCGLSWPAVFLAQAVFGLAPTNYETLAWSVQGSAVLSVTFMLLALDDFFRSPFRTPSFVWATASALSFSRGVLTGPMLACASLLGEGEREGSRPQKRLACAAGYLFPSVVVALLIATMATGNHQHMKGHEADAALYGLWYYCLNPVHQLFAVESWGPRTVTLLGLIKIGLVAWSLAQSRGRLRLLFILLAAFDAGNALLLGIGRYHTGLPTTVASRYQYASLIGSVPWAGFLFSRACDRVCRASRGRTALVGVLLIALGWALFRGWTAELEPFTSGRGTESRRLLFVDPAPGPHAVPGIPGLPMDRAKTLIANYTLH